MVFIYLLSEALGVPIALGKVVAVSLTGYLIQALLIFLFALGVALMGASPNGLRDNIAFNVSTASVSGGFSALAYHMVMHVPIMMACLGITTLVGSLLVRKYYVDSSIA